MTKVKSVVHPLRGCLKIYQLVFYAPFCALLRQAQHRNFVEISLNSHAILVDLALFCIKNDLYKILIINS